MAPGTSERRSLFVPHPGAAKPLTGGLVSWGHLHLLTPRLHTYLPASTPITLKVHTLLKVGFNQVRSSCNHVSHPRARVYTLSKFFAKLCPSHRQNRGWWSLSSSTHYGTRCDMHLAWHLNAERRELLLLLQGDF